MLLNKSNNVKCLLCRFLQDRFRTPAGRRIVFLNIDTTNVSVDQSEDALAQMRTYSGKREYRHCLLFSNITCARGSLVAITPGPNISCTPRGGDGTSLGVQFNISRVQGLTGFARLLAGSQNTGVGLVVDRGYLFDAPNVDTGDNPSVVEFCEENDVLLLYRSMVGEQCFR